MEWTELKIYTSSDGVEIVTGRLIDIGISGFVIQDKNDFEDFLQRKNGNWDYIDDDLYELRTCETSVTVYIPCDESGMEMLLSVRAEIAALKALDTDGQYGKLECELSQIREEDWANNWKQYFKPLKIGDRLLIKPSWELAPQEDGRCIVEIDPAASFGTGQHNTTQLCLELLEKNLSQGDRLLDLGCGSGILSVAAMKLGAQSACAVDIEESAVKVAEENALKNAVPADKYTCMCGDIISDGALRDRIGGGYDIVCANIVADVLVAMSPYFSLFVRDGGRLVVSGIIEKRRDEVVGAIERGGFKMIEERQKDDWIACAFAKAVSG